MKILQIYELDPLNRIGGVETAIFELSRHLVKRGHEITVISGADSPCKEIKKDGVKFIYLDIGNIIKKIRSCDGLSLTRQAVFLPIVLSKDLRGYDIYHGHIYTSGIAANILARKYNGVAVNTIHGSYYPEWNSLVNPLSALLYKSAERILAPTLAHFSCSQIHTGQYFARQVISWGVDKEKIRVIYNGVDCQEFNPGIKKAVTGYPCPVILSARRLVKKNGLDRLLSVMPYILRNVECKLLIIGDGPERSNLVDMAKKLGIGNNVEFLGSIPHKDIAGYIAIADIAVLPSIVEASSIFMLEAMAMCKPVVATGAWGLSEIINGKNGLIAKADRLGEEIVELLLDKKKLNEIGTNARKYVIENHSWDKIAECVESEYLRI